jgi:hypothetical protein
MTSHETPAEHLERHAVTTELRRRGVTVEQLQAMSFRGSRHDGPFDFWPCTWLAGTPDDAIPLIKAYCALKWLILENPPSSREKDDAWRHVADQMAAPIFAIGMRAMAAQRDRARKPRGKVTVDGKTITRVITELALKPEYREERAKGLWRHFHAELDRLELDPEEKDDSANSENSSYEYDFGNGRKLISYRRLANIVSNCRRKQKSL